MGLKRLIFFFDRNAVFFCGGVLLYLKCFSELLTASKKMT